MDDFFLSLCLDRRLLRGPASDDAGSGGDSFLPSLSADMILYSENVETTQNLPIGGTCKVTLPVYVIEQIRPGEFVRVINYFRLLVDFPNTMSIGSLYSLPI